MTSLANRAMPLIRYEIGDTGELLAERCPCGRGLPLMRPTWGRSADYLALVDGTVITPYDMTCAIEHLPAPNNRTDAPRPACRGLRPATFCRDA